MKIITPRDSRFELEARAVLADAHRRYPWTRGVFSLPQQLGNYAQTTLASGCTSGALTIAVTSASGFPVLGNFMIRIDDVAPATTYEFAEVTGVSGGTFTVTRGQEGTTGIAHSAGAIVGNDMTAAMLERRLQLPLQSSESGSYSTASTTPVMAGMARALTPTQTGRVLVLFGGQASNTVNTGGGTMQVRYGTGTAPTAGAALTGTAAVFGRDLTEETATYTRPWSAFGIVTGLTIGIAYWFDMSIQTLNGGTVTYSRVDVVLMEF